MARTTQGSEPLDLEGMSDEQLQALQTRVRQMLDDRVRSRIDEFRRIARDAGYELALTRIGEERRRRGSRDGMRDRRDRRSDIAPKYRNPDDPSESWSGRGREPKWMQREIASGKSKEDFLIEREDRLPLGEEAPS